MVVRHEIHADEGWTHATPPLHRYWCFYGGLFGAESDIGRLTTTLQKRIASHRIQGEVKWTKLSARNLGAYKAFVDDVLREIEDGNIRFRQMLCDRSLVRVAPHGEGPVSDLDIQFKLCYQFLKHSFGLSYLPDSDQHEVLVRLDGHSSQKHKKQLVAFATGLPGVLRHKSLTLKVTFVRSEHAPLVQASDLLIGAAGSHGNNMASIRKAGQRGMTPIQKIRDELCSHIYNGLKTIDASSRGSAGFNWFECTGKDGDRANLLHHKVRVWRFCPKMYQIDRGWLNKNLNKQGQYTGRLLDSTIHSVDPNDTFTY